MIAPSATWRGAGACANWTNWSTSVHVRRFAVLPSNPANAEVEIARPVEAMPTVSRAQPPPRRSRQHLGVTCRSRAGLAVYRRPKAVLAEASIPRSKLVKSGGLACVACGSRIALPRAC
jgi:hypothetical protein